ncbi:MAG: primase-helicase family protein [Steroidobacterales bacterium]
MTDGNKDSVGQTDVTTQRAQAALRLRERAALEEIPAPTPPANLFPAVGTSLQEAIASDAGAAAAAQARREADAAARRAAARESAVTEPARDYVFPSREHAEAAITQRFGMLNDSGQLSVWDSHTKTELGITGFNREWGRHMPELPMGGKSHKTYRPVPFDVLADSRDRHSCRGIRFDPGAGPFFTLRGVEYANSYRGHPTDERPTKGDPEAQRAARVFVKFARHLFPRSQFGSLNKIPFLAQLLDMHAYTYRHPGRRASFCMVLAGETEGSGKTTLMKGVTGAIHGHWNRFSVGSKELFSDFNSFEERHRFGVMDELQVKGAEGKARLDGIKTSISETDVRVVAKGKDGHTAENRVTWLATTNFPIGAIPLSDTARRFWLEETPAGKLPRELARELNELLAPETSTSPGGIGGAVLRAYLRARYDRPGFDFDPWAQPPDNAALAAAKDASIPREQELLEDLLEGNGQLTRGFGTQTDIESALYASGYRPPREPMSREQLWRLFQKALARKEYTLIEKRHQPKGIPGRPSYRFWYQDPADVRPTLERYQKFIELAKRGLQK